MDGNGMKMALMMISLADTQTRAHTQEHHSNHLMLESEQKYSGAQRLLSDNSWPTPMKSVCAVYASMKESLSGVEVL